MPSYKSVLWSWYYVISVLKSEQTQGQYMFQVIYNNGNGHD